MAEYLQADKKQEIFAKYGKSNTDTGSPESQVALFSYRINHLTEHVKKNKKDVVTRRSLLRLVGKRRQLLDYLQKIDIERYRKIVKELGLLPALKKQQKTQTSFHFRWTTRKNSTPRGVSLADS